MGNNPTHTQKLQQGIGYRIIQVQENSIAEKAGLQIFLDYIIDVQIMIDKDKKQNENLLKCLNQNIPIEITVFNIFTQLQRNLRLRENLKEDEDANLGLCKQQYLFINQALRLESYENPLVLRITNVLSNSPAEKCGLSKQSDFVLGLLSHTFTSLNEFSDIVNGIAYRKGQKLDLCVFSPTTSKSPRMIYLEPDFKWGGPGCLGCEFASGILHSFTNQNKLNEQPEALEEVSLDSLLKKNEEMIQEQLIEEYQDHSESGEEEKQIEDGKNVEIDFGQNQEIENQIQNEISEIQEEEKKIEEIKKEDDNEQSHQFKGVLRFGGQQFKKKFINKEIVKKLLSKFRAYPLREKISGQLMIPIAQDNKLHLLINRINKLIKVFLAKIRLLKLVNYSDINFFFSVKEPPPQIKICEDQQIQVTKDNITPNNTQGFHSPKQQKQYQIDPALLFDLSVQLEFRPIYLF